MVALAEGQGQGPLAAILAGKGERRIKASGLAGLEVEAFDPAAVDDVRIVRIGRDLVAFAAGGDLMELGDGDAVRHVVASARDCSRARILL